MTVTKVVVAQPIAQEGIDLLVECGLDVSVLERCDVDALIREVADAAGLLVRDAWVPAEVIENAGRLKVISRHGVGTERIDLNAAMARGIIVTNTPEANCVAVAEHVLALMFSLAKNLRRLDIETRRGHFEVGRTTFGLQLAGLTLGIIGLGNIGRSLAGKAITSLGMEVIGYDPHVDPELLPVGIEFITDLRDVLRRADVISIHTPLNDETRGMIGLAEFSLMKRSALFINCARGPIVKEADLVAALRRGLIGGAGIDVFDPHPPASNHPLYGRDDVILTPHTAAHTREALHNMATHAAQGIIDVLAGRRPAWPVSRI